MYVYEYQVQHQPWKIFPVKNHLVDCDFETLYRAEFSILHKLKPASVFVARDLPFKL